MKETPTKKSLTRRFLELIRFSHTIFALPFAVLASVWALVLPLHASVPPPPPQLGLRLLGVLLCMVSGRSAAMAFNRLVDARFDAANPRTAGRHLPAGEITALQAWSFFALMVAIFFGACVLFLPNWLPLVFAAPVLAWICGYSLAKRFTSAVHLWLGVALALSPVCAWVAIRGEELIAIPSDCLPAVGLALAIACWVAGFDIIYACQDAEFDRGSGLHSVPARFGIAGGLRIAGGLHATMLLVLGLLPILFPQLSLGWLYWLGLFAIAALLVRQHAILSPSDLGRINEAFFQLNAVISFCLCSLAALDAWMR